MSSSTTTASKFSSLDQEVSKAAQAFQVSTQRADSFIKNLHHHDQQKQEQQNIGGNAKKEQEVAAIKKQISFALEGVNDAVKKTQQVADAEISNADKIIASLLS